MSMEDKVPFHQYCANEEAYSSISDKIASWMLPNEFASNFFDWVKEQIHKSQQQDGCIMPDESRESKHYAHLDAAVDRMAYILRDLFEFQHLTLESILPFIYLLAEITPKKFHLANESAVLLDDQSTKHFIVRFFQLLHPLVVNLGSCIMRHIASSPVLSQQVPEFCSELLNLADDNDLRFEVERHTVPLQFVRPVREDLDNRLQHKGGSGDYNEREKCYDEFINLFHAYQNILHNTSFSTVGASSCGSNGSGSGRRTDSIPRNRQYSSAKKINNNASRTVDSFFWSQTFSQHTRKVLALSQMNLNWFAELFVQLMIFHGPDSLINNSTSSIAMTSGTQYDSSTPMKYQAKDYPGQKLDKIAASTQKSSGNDNRSIRYSHDKGERHYTKSYHNQKKSVTTTLLHTVPNNAPQLPPSSNDSVTANAFPTYSKEFGVGSSSASGGPQNESTTLNFLRTGAATVMANTGTRKQQNLENRLLGAVTASPSQSPLILTKKLQLANRLSSKDAPTVVQNEGHNNSEKLFSKGYNNSSVTALQSTPNSRASLTSHRVQHATNTNLPDDGSSSSGRQNDVNDLSRTISPETSGVLSFFYHYIITVNQVRVQQCLVSAVVNEILIQSKIKPCHSRSTTKVPFTLQILRLKLLGKLLGFLEIQPFLSWTGHSPFCGIKVNRPFGDCTFKKYPIITWLESAYLNGHVSLSVAWISELFIMTIEIYLCRSSRDASLDSSDISKSPLKNSSTQHLYSDAINYLTLIQHSPIFNPIRGAVSANRLYFLHEIHALMKQMNIIANADPNSAKLPNHTAEFVEGCTDNGNDAFNTNFLNLVTSSCQYFVNHPSHLDKNSDSEKIDNIKSNITDVPRSKDAPVNISTSVASTSLGTKQVKKKRTDDTIAPINLFSSKSEETRSSLPEIQATLQSSFWHQHPHLQRISTFLLEHINVACTARLKDKIAFSVRLLWSKVAENKIGIGSKNSEIINRSSMEEIDSYEEKIRSISVDIEKNLIQDARLFLSHFVQLHLCSTLYEICSLAPVSPMVIDLAVYLIKQQSVDQHDSLLEYVSSYGHRKLREVCILALKQYTLKEKDSRGIDHSDNAFQESSSKTVELSTAARHMDELPSQSVVIENPVVTTQSHTAKDFLKLAHELKQLSLFFDIQSSETSDNVHTNSFENVAHEFGIAKLWFKPTSIVAVQVSETQRESKLSLQSLHIGEVLKLVSKKMQAAVNTLNDSFIYGINCLELCTAFIDNTTIDLHEPSSVRERVPLRSILIIKFITVALPYIIFMDYCQDLEHKNREEDPISSELSSKLIARAMQSTLLTLDDVLKILTSISRKSSLSYYEHCIKLSQFSTYGKRSMLQLLKGLIIAVDSSLNKLFDKESSTSWHNNVEILESLRANKNFTSDFLNLIQSNKC